MTYVPGLKTKIGNLVSGSGFNIVNNMVVSGNSNIGLSQSNILITATIRPSSPFTIAGGISSSHVSTGIDSLAIAGNSDFNTLTASSGLTNGIQYGSNDALINSSVIVGSLSITSSNISTTNNSATILYSYPTKNDTTYFIESQIMAKKNDYLTSSIYSIRSVYKNITGTLYLTGTSTLYSSSDFYQSSTLLTSYIDVSPLNLTSVLTPGIQSWAMSSLYDANLQKYYLAFGHYLSASTQGGFKIFSSSNNIDWDGPLASYAGDINSNLGAAIKLVSSSYGLYCFVSAVSSSGGNYGSLHYVTASDGKNWSSLTQISASSVSGNLGNSLDCLFDNNKFILLAGAYLEDTSRGYVYILTSSNGVNWTTGSRIMSGNGTIDACGQSVAILSCSTGYQAYAAARIEDLPSSSIGNIYLVTSSNASTWSSQIVIASGAYTNNTSTDMGIAGISVLDYNSKSYVFFAEPSYDTGSTSTSNEGAIYVISSSDNNSWGTINVSSSKTLLVTGSKISDQVTKNTAYTKLISVKKFNNKIYYAFAAPFADSDSFVNAGKVYFGTSSDGVNWQKFVSDKQDMVVFSGTYAPGAASNGLGSSIDLLANDSYVNLYCSNTGTVFYANVAYLTQSGSPAVDLTNVSFGISSSNITINVTGSTGINIEWNHLTKIYEV